MIDSIDLYSIIIATVSSLVASFTGPLWNYLFKKKEKKRIH